MTLGKRATSQGSVKKNPTRGTWEFVVWVIDPSSPKGKRQVRRKGFPTKRHAEEALSELHAKVRKAIKDGQQIVRKQDTLAEYLQNIWLPVIQSSPRLKPTTKSYYRFAAKYLIKHLGHHKIIEVTGSHLEALYATLRDSGKSASLIRGVHITAHKAFDFAIREGLITWNPSDRIDAPATSKGNPHAWSEAEMQKIFEIADADRFWAAWRLFAATGLRRGELCGLKWSDIHDTHLTVTHTRLVVDGKVIDGTPKTSKSARKIPLNRIATDTLKVWQIAQLEQLRNLGIESAPIWVFTNEIGGPIDPGHLSKRWNKIIKKAKVSTYPLHALRHTFATSLLARRNSPKVVQDLLGHSSITVTLDLYTAALDELGVDAVESLENQLPIGPESSRT
jgi:integrase